MKLYGQQNYSGRNCSKCKMQIVNEFLWQTPLSKSKGKTSTGGKGTIKRTRLSFFSFAFINLYYSQFTYNHLRFGNYSKLFGRAC